MSHRTLPGLSATNCAYRTWGPAGGRSALVGGALGECPAAGRTCSAWWQTHKQVSQGAAGSHLPGVINLLWLRRWRWAPGRWRLPVSGAGRGRASEGRGRGASTSRAHAQGRTARPQPRHGREGHEGRPRGPAAEGGLKGGTQHPHVTSAACDLHGYRVIAHHGTIPVGPWRTTPPPGPSAPGSRSRAAEVLWTTQRELVGPLVKDRGGKTRPAYLVLARLSTVAHPSCPSSVVHAPCRTRSLSPRPRSSQSYPTIPPAPHPHGRPPWPRAEGPSEGHAPWRPHRAPEAPAPHAHGGPPAHAERRVGHVVEPRAHV
jgi:hypothetical protein